MRDIIFLTLSEVVDIHADQIARYGGKNGIRDIKLLSSAVAMPLASFSNKYLHSDIMKWLQHMCFVSAKIIRSLMGIRTALASARVFLELNGISISDPKGTLYDAMISLASGKLRKAEFAAILRSFRKIAWGEPGPSGDARILDRRRDRNRIRCHCNAILAGVILVIVGQRAHKSDTMIQHQEGDPYAHSCGGIL